MRLMWPIALGALVVGSACVETDVACTAVGKTSSVAIQVADPFTLDRFCLEDRDCKGGESVAIPVADEPATYAYQIRLTSPTAEPQTIEGEVATEEFFVNGPDCEPRTANATLTVDSTGAVSVSHP